MFLERLSLKATIALSIITMGLLAVVLALLVENLNHRSAIDNQRESLREIIRLRTDDLLQELTRHSQQLGQALQSEKTFRQSYVAGDEKALNDVIRSQFRQYFVTSGIIKLENISVYDTEFRFISNVAIDEDARKRYQQLNCTHIIERAKQRTGAERLKQLSELCIVNNEVRMRVIMPIGGLRVIGYLEVDTDPAFSLQKIEDNLGMPLTLINANDQVSYRSADWPQHKSGRPGIVASYMLRIPGTQSGLKIQAYKNIEPLLRNIAATRMQVFATTSLTTIVLATLFLLALRRTTFRPLDKLGQALSSVLAEPSGKEQVLEIQGNTELKALMLKFNDMVRYVNDAYTKLEAARDDALQASRAKSQFLANMSHELRTPLNAIIGFTELNLDEPTVRDNESLTQDMHNVLGAARHLLSLINSTLDLAKIGTGTVEVDLHEVSVSEIISAAKHAIQPFLRTNSNTLVINHYDDIGTIVTDASRLHQILLNLLNNASKFTEHGTITLTVNRTENENGETIHFCVEDTGIGLSAEEMDILFEAFTQADNSSTRKYGGTGLGLVVSRELSRLLGGDITVTSAPGQGSTFCVTLPIRPMGNTPATA